VHAIAHGPHLTAAALTQALERLVSRWERRHRLAGSGVAQYRLPNCSVGPLPVLSLFLSGLSRP
jgi:hypothetical protein